MRLDEITWTGGVGKKGSLRMFRERRRNKQKRVSSDKGGKAQRVSVLSSEAKCPRRE
jgi:hypothetical protein